MLPLDTVDPSKDIVKAKRNVISSLFLVLILTPQYSSLYICI